MREIVFDFCGPEERVQPCTSAKSTLIGASVLALRERGHFDRYVELVDPGVRDAILYTPAGVWLPIRVAEAHYAACDALGLSAQEVLAMGNAVARLTQKTVLALALRLATEGGTTPWTILKQTPRLWARLYEHSALALHKVGPKDAELSTSGNSLAQFQYWRTGLRGIVHSLVTPFATRAYVRELSWTPTSDWRASYRISWA